MKWIKKHPRQAAAYVGGTLVATGIFMMLPRSPWTLIVAGAVVLFFTLVSLFDDAPN